MKNLIKIFFGATIDLYTGWHLMVAEPGTAFINQFYFYGMVIGFILIGSAAYDIKFKK